MLTIPAKTILARRPQPDAWFGCDYNMNIYKGCCHGCIYCDSRSECYQVEDFDTVRAKQDALDILEKELKTKRKKGVVGMGAMSDPYNPFEARELLTQGALKRIHQYRCGVCLATKSDLIVRDIPQFLEIAAHSPVCLKITVTTFDDGLCQKIEPNVAPSSRRFAAIKALKQAGIYAGLLLMPVLPFINDTVENITGIVEAAAQNGADFVYPAFGVTLRQNQRDYFYAALDRQFPGYKQRYVRAFGNDYTCVSPNAKKLWQVFTGLCQKYSIRCQMPEIIAGYKTEKHMQMMFF